MDRLLELLNQSIPYLHLLTAVILLLKVVIVLLNKGIDVIAVIGSFFRIYSYAEVDMTTDTGRQSYMKLNNYINIYLYVWMLLTCLNFLIFKSLF